MKKLNKKVGILLGAGAILLAGVLIERITGKKEQDMPKITSSDFDFVKIKDDENTLCKDDFEIKEEEENFLKQDNGISFLRDEYMKEKIKTDEELGEVLGVLLKEILSISENISRMEKEMKSYRRYEEVKKELEEEKEEIISLWEHIEALSNSKEVKEESLWLM